LYSIGRNKWTCIYSYDSSRDRNGKNGSTHPREPCPRYAHQLVYDHESRIHYLFGGNPGNACRELRLDDFWSLKLLRISRAELLRKFQFIIRRQHFSEIVRVDAAKGLKYLRSMIGTLVDPEDADQVKELHRLAGTVCDPVSDGEEDVHDEREAHGEPMVQSEDEDGACDGQCCDFLASWPATKANKRSIDSRVQVFDLISSFFPDSMTQPKANLSDLVIL
jgi:hypothetical protein